MPRVMDARGPLALGLGLGLALLALLPGRAVTAAPCADCLEAGAAMSRLATPPGTPLAGYGSIRRRLIVPDVLGWHAHAFWFRPAEGERDPIAARALVLARGDTRVAWVSVDLVAVDRAFTESVERRLSAQHAVAPTLIISASHTHSGPGAFVDSEVMGLVAADRLDTTVRAALVDSVADAVQRADAARGPARVAIAEVTAPSQLTRGRLALPVDPTLTVLKVTRPGGGAVAALWNYAIHGTMLGPRNLRLSGDVMGVASREVERVLGAPALYVNGAVGDVSPARHGEAAAEDVGRELARLVERGWAAAEPMEGSLRVARVMLGLPSPRLSVANCLRGWAPRALTLPLGSTMPRDAELLAVAIGNSAWVAVPGELQTALGQAIRQGGRAAFGHALIAGVSNDYLGYFVTAREYEQPGYVTCATLYGPTAGACLVDAATDLVNELRTGGARPDGGRARISSGRRYCGE
jgi:neutral/alkaline ceramidase-like enzyme